jgi:LDH2 family malate/lactate/ureidoglycolate dehydrogenase
LPRPDHDEVATMIGNQLWTTLDRRAGAFLAAAQFASDAAHLRAAAIVGASAIVARNHGISGVEGYLAAVMDLGTADDRLAVRAIRDAVDEAIVAVAAAAWMGNLPAMDRAPTSASSAETRPVAA